MFGEQSSSLFEAALVHSLKPYTLYICGNICEHARTYEGYMRGFAAGGALCEVGGFLRIYVRVPRTLAFTRKNVGITNISINM